MKNSISRRSFLKAVGALSAAGALAACGGSSSSSTAASSTAASAAASTAAGANIKLWTYPIGGWGKDETVQELISSFNAKYPDIKVTVEYLDYTNGDDQVNTAIEGGSAPDLVMEGPERLVANWGAKGLMVDLSDLWTDDQKADISASVESACKDSSGAYYEFPLCMTAHCMAINKTVFEAADAMQYVDAENHTWTTDNFLKAVQAVYDSGKTDVGAIYCSGQGGDQGTRAIINNMYGGTFTDAAHTKYTADSAENVTLPSRPTATTARPAPPTTVTTSCSWRSPLSPAIPLCAAASGASASSTTATRTRSPLPRPSSTSWPTPTRPPRPSRPLLTSL